MRIAQVSPLYESVPPKAYGGTERVVSYLTEELVERGHEVVLYASGDSTTRACLKPQSPRSLRLDVGCTDPLPHHHQMLENVYRDADHYDVIHFHVDYLHFASSARQTTPTLTTLHGRLDLPGIAPLFSEFRWLPFISISDAQRRPLPHLNWQATIHHGLPPDLYSFSPTSQDYLAFVGRISPEKRVDRAIEIAVRTGIPIKIAAKMDAADEDYWRGSVESMFQHPLVEYVGEVDDARKAELLGGARALLFPIDWPEPFGIVMIEAMACGTPVVAYPCGSVPEVVDPGVTGFVVSSIDEAVSAVESLGNFDRKRCRTTFERRFTVQRMVDDYLDVYDRLARVEVPDAVRFTRRTG